MLKKIKFIVKSQYGAKDEERMVTEKCAAQFERAGLIAKEEKAVIETKEEKMVVETKKPKAKITKSPR
jgi:hypothetical protein